MSLYRDTVAVCRMIKIEHSVFALPFAFTGAFLAQGAGPDWTLPSWRVMAPLTVAMVAVRCWTRKVATSSSVIVICERWFTPIGSP